MGKEQRFDIHQLIADQIVAAIERGAGEFRLPWHHAAGGIIRAPANSGANSRQVERSPRLSIGRQNPIERRQSDLAVGASIRER